MFDRRALTVPTYEEDFARMINSLNELRVDLQRSGVSGIRNLLLRGLFEQMKSDLVWLEEVVEGLARSGVANLEEFYEGKAVFWAPMTSGVLRELPEQSQEAGEETTLGRHSVSSAIAAFEEAHQLVDTMVERAWRSGYGEGIEYMDSKEVRRDRLPLAMTAMYLLALLTRFGHTSKQK